MVCLSLGISQTGSAAPDKSPYYALPEGPTKKTRTPTAVGTTSNTPTPTETLPATSSPTPTQTSTSKSQNPTNNKWQVKYRLFNSILIHDLHLSIQKGRY